MKTQAIQFNLELWINPEHNETITENFLVLSPAFRMLETANTRLKEWIKAKYSDNDDACLCGWNIQTPKHFATVTRHQTTIGELLPVREPIKWEALEHWALRLSHRQAVPCLATFLGSLASCNKPVSDENLRLFLQTALQVCEEIEP